MLSSCVGDSGAAVTVAPEELIGPGEVSYTVVVIGDSISTGYQTSAEDAWPTRLEQKMTAQGIPLTLINAAEDGAGYLVEGSGGKTFQQQAEASVPSNANAVIVYGSENDIGYQLGKINLEVEATAAAVKQRAPQADLLVVGPASYSSEVNPDLLTIRDQIKQGAQSAGADFIDPIAERWIMDDESELIGPDGDHPSIEGHIYLEQKFEALLQPLLHPIGESTGD